MANPSYPANLPIPKIEGYNITTKLPYLSSEIKSIDILEQRRTYDHNLLSEVSLVWIFTQSNYDTFINWFDNTLNNGVNWFECDFLADSKGLVEKDKVRFVKGYSLKLLSAGIWEVKATLETNQLHMISEADFNNKIGNFIPDAELIKMSNDLHNYLNNTLPSIGGRWNRV